MDGEIRSPWAVINMVGEAGRKREEIYSRDASLKLADRLGRELPD